MSLFSRFFRKVPSPAPAPAPSRQASKAPPKTSAADRALTDDAERKALQSAVEAEDAQAIARLVVAGSSTRIRQAAASAIQDPDLLRQLIRDVRGGKDNNVYKILTAKRDALLEQARKLEQLQAGIRDTAAALERHSQRPYDALYGPRLEQYEISWNEVAAQADPELRGKVQQWIDRSRQTVAEHHRQVAEQAAREQAAIDAAAEARRLREQQAQESAAAAAEQARVASEQKRALSEQQQAEQQGARQIGELIRKARAALGDGSTSRAAGIRRTIEEKLPAAQPLPANLASQIQQLDNQIAELKDWKSFSVAPKRAELIEEMESLIGVPLDPQALADRIKGLQDEWRTLSKGADESLEAEWQRFHQAAQKAYQPCSEYFAAQALVRAENLQRRDALLARLTAFAAEYNWEQADWRDVIRTLRETKEEWRNCSPVDRQAAKAQQKGFDTLTASLQGRVDAEHARNLKQKEALIERARQLLASDDNRKAIDAIKGLQQQWQAVGPVPREADQRLWGEFRQHCDAVFQRRQQAVAAFTADLENNKAQALALCEQIESIAALEGPELLARAGALAELRSAFEALGELPRADTRELRNRLDQGLDRCRKAVARQHARDAEHSWSDLFTAADHVRRYRLALASGADTQPLGALKEAAESHIASVQRWPKGGLDALRQSLAREPSADLQAHENALKLLCIRAELVTDTPTPPEDQALRREYQLQRLVQGMGQGSRADETPLDAMAIEWIGIGPVEDMAYEPLLQRFRRCRELGSARA
ncbi:DUF349 domain-containing protein [Solimonas sp. SE-A11]|uniref:DUF349 domain-containing protein n=1 Tax=Solimonas sp. SE-A11 TaxID=3054954 RepID=UPI00259C6FEE|nr:DUF349 domain-containing protein [Solimonas sp. SE-A11]MDM4769941.1 DUF349 domain-containing protein [Solimonas sp. SE-A11]